MLYHHLFFLGTCTYICVAVVIQCFLPVFIYDFPTRCVSYNCNFHLKYCDDTYQIFNLVCYYIMFI